MNNHPIILKSHLSYHQLAGGQWQLHIMPLFHFFENHVTTHQMVDTEIQKPIVKQKCPIFLLRPPFMVF